MPRRHWGISRRRQRIQHCLQRIKTLLAIHGRAAVVVIDNVLFAGGADETIRRKRLHECDGHPTLRLPTGIFYGH